jgi:hypothetical protein
MRGIRLGGMLIFGFRHFAAINCNGNTMDEVELSFLKSEGIKEMCLFVRNKFEIQGVHIV